MDRFPNTPRKIAKQLRKDPSLSNNRQWVENHPALQEFLQTHPGVREEFRENPNAFMQPEERFDQREDHRDRDRDGDRGTTRRELTTTAPVLKRESKIAELARKNAF